ncbi:hypothetical protein, partial [Escherichia coli]|uniref:hypothetical protein n=1 Tax=Escherichia coli TaxID=562 RepID=UPI0039754772
TSFSYQIWVFNLRILSCFPSFRIYRETLSRFRAPLHDPQNQGITPERTCEQKAEGRDKGRAGGVFP